MSTPLSCLARSLLVLVATGVGLLLPVASVAQMLQPTPPQTLRPAPFPQQQPLPSPYGTPQLPPDPLGTVGGQGTTPASPWGAPAQQQPSHAWSEDSAGTARSQGARGRDVHPDRYAYLRAKAQRLTHPRHKGQRVSVPYEGTPVAHAKDAQVWRDQWQWTLDRAEEDAQRVQFEMHRLSEEEFASWAHRRCLWAEQRGTPCPPSPSSH